MQEIIPVLLGADLNCYHVARAFHEAYGVKTYAFGRYAISATKYSRIIQFTVAPRLEEEEYTLPMLQEFAKSHTGAKLILMGCTDHYAEFIIRHKDELKDYIAPAPSADLYTSLQKKEAFYQICDQYMIPYPKSVIIHEKKEINELLPEVLGFSYPVIIKPSSSVIYWEHPFDGMKKVYLVSSPEKAETIINEIYQSGYNDSLILQKYVPGEDDHMRVLTTFSDENGRVRAMCLGHTMLEEHTPKGLGNHAAILVEPVSSVPVCEKLKDLLNEIRYTGFANFDIKYCEEENEFYVFEINLRQGRSNYYLTGSGLNVARLVNETYTDGLKDVTKVEKNHFWHFIPSSVAFSYTADEVLVKKAKSLQRSGNSSTSLKYPYDLCFNPLRLLCVQVMMHRQKKKYKLYCKKYR